MESRGKDPYSPSAPPAPDSSEPPVAHPYNPPPQTTTYGSSPQPQTQPKYGSGPQPHPAYGSGPKPNPGYVSGPQPHPMYGSGPQPHPMYGSGPQPHPMYGSYPYPYPQQQQQQNLFPPGTDPEVIRSFEMVDINRSGFVEESELQQALLRTYQRFSLKTLRLLIFLFKSNRESSNRLGPKEFAEVWSCLGQWRAIFERFDRDRSGKIDAVELRDALYSLGYAVPPSVLQVLISRYDDGSGRRVELNFDSFVECGMILKGLTEKFKEKDPRYTGSATLTYETFMSMIIPFLVAD